MTTILGRYIARAVIGGTALVMLVLLALSGFIEFFAQLDDTGEGSYDVLLAGFYVILRLPKIGVDMLPAATLIGALLGLGNLASRSELVAMRAAGLSRRRLALSVGTAGVLLMFLTGVVGEYFAPTLSSYARQMRAMAKHDELDMSATGNAWIKDGDTIINMRSGAVDGQPGGIYLFDLGSGPSLDSIGRADDAEPLEGTNWLLENYAETRFGENAMVAEAAERSLRANNVTEELLAMTSTRRSDLNLRGLWRYIEYLRANKLDAASYEIAFWSRVANIVAIVAMAVLALPFVFGSLRQAGVGARLIVGLLIGLGYFLVSRTLAQGSVVFDLNPLVVAWAPTVVLIALTALAVARVR